MKTFKRNRTMEELREACAERGWTLDTGKHDKEGSDFVSFYWHTNAPLTKVTVI